MSDPRPNPARGELALVIAGHRWRLVPSFAALARAEEEGKPLLQLVEEAAAGRTRLADMVLLVHHCLVASNARPLPDREAVGAALMEGGLAQAAHLYRRLLEAALGLPGEDAPPPSPGWEAPDGRAD
ncbi:MAG: gene transfer agent family protein [Alphaproteobacteria bacterium]|nr:MAG: gene transfer agent family protein [Alphaproteobacteria bacterium]